MSPLILPVISGEEDRGVWSSNKKQKKNLQVDQEGGFSQQNNILGFAPQISNKELDKKNERTNKINPKGGKMKRKVPQSTLILQKSLSVCAQMQSATQPDAR